VYPCYISEGYIILVEGKFISVGSELSAACICFVCLHCVEVADVIVIEESLHNDHYYV
jgi:hypothetical protein